MVTNMFRQYVGCEVEHEKYGKGEIIKVTNKPKVEVLNNLVRIKFKDGKIRSFPIFNLKYYFKEVPEEIIQHITELEPKEETVIEKHDYNFDLNLYNIENTPVENLEKSIRVATNYRFRDEAMVIVMDDSTMFENAQFALYYLGEEINDQNVETLYRACDNNTSLYEHDWRRATADEIRGQIKIINGELK